MLKKVCHLSTGSSHIPIVIFYHVSVSSQSLHESTTNEDPHHQSADLALQSYQEELTSIQLQLETAHKENNRLVSQLRTTTIDKTQLEKALESVTKDKDRQENLLYYP